VTLLLPDVEGSTRLWETQPEAMSAAIAVLDRKLSELVAGHDGVGPVEQGEGDSFVLAFARASDRGGMCTGVAAGAAVRRSTGRRGCAISPMASRPWSGATGLVTLLPHVKMRA
jgi:class 3 adenylate cyclase